MRKTTITLATIIGLGAAACASSGTTTSTKLEPASRFDTSQNADRQPELTDKQSMLSKEEADLRMWQCPMRVPGAEVRAVDLSGGIALEFTSSGDNVALIRNRAEQLTGAYADILTAPGEESLTTDVKPAGTVMKVPAIVTYQEVSNGGRLIYEPLLLTDIMPLRSEVRLQAAAMQRRGDCSVLPNTQAAK